MSALRFLNSTTGTSVSTVNVTDVFTSDFDIYKISINDVDLNTGGSTTNATIQMRFLNAAGTVETANDYDYAYHNVKSFSSFTEGKGQNQTYIQGLSWIGPDAAHGSGMYCYIFNPYNNDKTTMGLFSSTTAIESGDKSYYTRGVCMYENIARMTGFELTSSTGSFDSIKVKTYGLRVT